MGEMLPLDVLHAEILACRQCGDAGYPVVPPPMVGGSGAARFMVIGQAPKPYRSSMRRDVSGAGGAETTVVAYCRRVQRSRL